MLLSVIVPTYNEEDVIKSFYQKLAYVLDSPHNDTEMIFVNDGSHDSTMEILLQLKEVDSRIIIVDLSRNFGKEIAMTAGLDYCKGDAVVIIDADLQDPPEIIPELVQKWQAGYDVVYAKRISRKGESALKKLTSKAFYRVIKRVSHVPIPEDTGDFRLMSRRAVNALNSLRERNRYMKGLFAWIGYSQTEVLYHRDPRYAGESKWSYLSLWDLAIEGITSFTVAPLKLSTYLGLLTATGAFIYGLWIIIKTVIYGDPVAGFPTMMVVILFLGGVQLLALGIIGEYLGRIFSESKQRPLYLINKLYKSEPEEVDRNTVIQDDSV
ncbi:MAG: glycosyltransferase family 2 protein [Gammaproteobacteria bacterium]|nr:MAG: glycosyltransferase family 2 protein [Gammaproteobacteria bacterium]